MNLTPCDRLPKISIPYTQVSLIDHFSRHEEGAFKRQSEPRRGRHLFSFHITIKTTDPRRLVSRVSGRGRLDRIPGSSPSLRPSSKADHTRLKCAFASCVHFVDHMPSAGSA